jgi:O-antigen/teichoic acid export membrane protein
VSSIKDKVLKATGWTAIGEIGQAALRFVSNFILARILSPEVFGLMAVVYAVMTGLHLFTEVGLRTAIIQHPAADDERFQNTAWTLQVLRGTVILTTTAVLAWPSAIFFKQQSMLQLLPAIGLTAFIEGFLPSRYHLANRHLLIGSITILTLVVAVASLFVRVGTALVWPSVWALVVGAWFNSLGIVVLSFVYLPGIPNRFRLDSHYRHELMKFGKWILISMVFVFLGSQLDRLIFAKAIPLGLLGAYNLALTIALMPSESLGKLIAGIGFPALSRIHERNGDINDALRAMRHSVLTPTGAISSLLMLTGPFIASLLFDARYRDVGWIIQWMAFAAWTRTMEALNANALMAMGLPKQNAVANMIKVASMAVLLPLGIWLGGESHRFLGGLIGLLLSDTIKYLVSTIQASLKGISGWRQELEGSAALAASAGAVVVCEWGPLHGLPTLPRVFIYTVVLFAGWGPIAIKTFKEVRVHLPAGLSRQPR